MGRSGRKSGAASAVIPSRHRKRRVPRAMAVNMRVARGARSAHSMLGAAGRGGGGDGRCGDGDGRVQVGFGHCDGLGGLDGDGLDGRDGDGRR